MGDEGDFWRDVKEAQRERHQHFTNNFHSKGLPKIRALCAELGLYLDEFDGGNHFRVENEDGHRIDFWHTGRVKWANGEYGFAGKHEETLKEAIKKLAK